MTTEKRKDLIQKLLGVGLKAGQKDSTARLLKKWQNYKKKKREEEDRERSPLLMTRNERNRRKRFRRAQRGK